MKGLLKYSAFLVLLSLCFSSCLSLLFGSGSETDRNDIESALKKATDTVISALQKEAIIAIVNISSNDSEVSEFIAGELEYILVNNGFNVVDRSQLDKIRQEQNFQLSGDVDDTSAVSIGKFAGANIVMTGAITGSGNMRRFRLRALDTQTARVLGSASEVLQDNSQQTPANVSYANNIVQQPSVVQSAPISYQIGSDEAVSAVNRTLGNNSEDFFLLAPGFSGWIVMETTGNVDTYIELYDTETNRMIAEDDDSGSGYNARIRYNVQSGHRYTVKVQGYDNGDYGFKAYREKVYQIGDRGPAGGIIFYDKVTFSDGWRYLEAAPADTEIPNARWGTYGRDVRGTRMDLGSGEENTAIINYYLMSINESGRAAQLCIQLNAGGYDDWFLPSMEELDWMYKNLHAKGLGGFKNERYWSSSQANSKKAWYRNFGDRGRASNDKDKDGDGWVFRYDIRVRAIRSF